MIRILKNILKKEFILTFKDIHALMVLFVMPMAFILVMSLALPDASGGDNTSKPVVGLIYETENAVQDLNLLVELPGFQLKLYKDKTDYRKNIINDQLIAMIVMPGNFKQSLVKGETVAKNMELYYSPRSPAQIRQLLLASLRQVMAMWQLEKKLAKKISDPFMQQGLKNKLLGMSLIDEHEFSDKKETQPSSVQQSVPAWLIFSMFFVVIPISTTFLVEKQHGTLQRLKTLPVADGYFLFGKIIPYFMINIIQTVLMFLVGIYLVPVAGGQALQLSANAWLLIPMAMSVSLLAISFAMLIAVHVNTTEQATTIGGVSNLLLAAIGGIMVPTYVMPAMMQNLSAYSPMNWGLEGFLTILLRDGSFVDIVPAMVKLIALSIVCLLFAVAAYRNMSQH